ncbi:MAG: cobaltochelatase subunit CobN [Butyricimonas faecihominis]
MNGKGPRGLAGGYLSASVVLRKLTGYSFYKCFPCRMLIRTGIINLFRGGPGKNLVDGIYNQIQLQRKENKDKRLAIVYLKGAGQSALTAAGLEVAPSLYAFLKRLKAEGYTVENIPATEKNLRLCSNVKEVFLGVMPKGKWRNSWQPPIRMD